MKFSLTFWIADPDGMDNVKSDVMLALWDAFKREGIRVPYPVREIRVRGGALPVEKPWSRFRADAGKSLKSCQAAAFATPCNPGLL